MATSHHAQRQNISTDPRSAIVRDQASGFVNGMCQRTVFAKELTLIAQMLSSLPLATDVYGLAENRLANARRYLDSGEFGAARYELRLLLGIISPRPAAEPIRRRR